MTPCERLLAEYTGRLCPICRNQWVANRCVAYWACDLFKISVRGKA